VRNFLLCALLCTSLTAFATPPAYVRSASNWGNHVATSCAVAMANTSTDLLVVWVSWTTSSMNNVAASAADGVNENGKAFPSAVGPTAQANSKTAAQIFYAKSIQNSSGSTVTVSFSGATTSSNCVIVEYSGADPSNPLDSVSAGYSTSAGNLMDSGNVSPANSNLLVFGAGFSDSTVGAIAGSGFTKHEENSGSWGTGIVENNSAAITGNNVLQRATACLSLTLTCNTALTGNWLMQMAVFRDASSTVQGGWSSVRPAQIRSAEQFPGNTADQRINAAIASLNGQGGTVDARGLQGAQNISATITVPGNTTLLLPPVPFTCTLSAAGACLSAGAAGWTGVGIIGAPGLTRNGRTVSQQQGTRIIISVSSAAGTVGVDFENGFSARVENLIVDNTNVSPNTQSPPCFIFAAVYNSRFSHLTGFGCAGDGYRFETLPQAALYDNVCEDCVVDGYGVNDTLSTNTSYGMEFTTAPSGANPADIDRFTCIACQIASNLPGGMTYTGAQGIYFQTGDSSAKSIADVTFVSGHIFSVQSNSPAITFSPSGAGPVLDFAWIGGEIETPSSNTSPAVTFPTDSSEVYNIHFDSVCYANFNGFHAYPMSVVGFTVQVCKTEAEYSGLTIGNDKGMAFRTGGNYKYLTGNAGGNNSVTLSLPAVTADDTLLSCNSRCSVSNKSFGGGNVLNFYTTATDAPGAITVNPQTCTDRSVSIAGVAASAVIVPSAGYVLEAGIWLSPGQAASGTAHYRICNLTASSIALSSSSSFNLAVIQ